MCPQDPGGWGLVIPGDYLSKTWLLDSGETFPSFEADLRLL